MDTYLQPIMALDSQAARHATPCGTGHLVWRSWPADALSAALDAPRLLPVVLVHGGSGAWTHWVRTIPALTGAGHEVWAVDLPGLGDSAMPPQPATPDICADIVGSGIATLFSDRETPHLVGFSWGAHVATLAATRLGTRIASLTIVGSSALGLGDAGLPPFPKLRAGQSAADRATVHRQTLEMLMVADPTRVDEMAVAIQDANASRARLRSSPFARSDDIARALGAVDVPVAGIWGERDVLAVPSIAAVYPALTGHRRPDQSLIGWRQIADAGHWVMYEQPTAFNAALIGILDS